MTKYKSIGPYRRPYSMYIGALKIEKGTLKTKNDLENIWFWVARPFLVIILGESTFFDGSWDLFLSHMAPLENLAPPPFSAPGSASALKAYRAYQKSGY